MEFDQVKIKQRLSAWERLVSIGRILAVFEKNKRTRDVLVTSIEILLDDLLFILDATDDYRYLTDHHQVKSITTLATVKPVLNSIANLLEGQTYRAKYTSGQLNSNCFPSF